MTRRGDTVWTPALDARLRAAWGLDLSANRIGEALGVSRNAVTGRARRIGLPKRPSPIPGRGHE